MQGSLPERIRRHRLPLLLGAALALALAALLPTTMALAAPAPACDLKCVQQFGDTKIQDRITSLNALNAKIGDLQTKGNLTADQSSALQGKITDAINGLKAQQTKLDAETDATAARADVRDIFVKFRIYAAFMPLVRHMVWVDLMTNAQAKMAGLNDKLTDAIAKAPAGQQTQLNKLFTDYKAKVADAQTQLTNAAATFDSITPDKFTSDHAAFLKALATLRTAAKAAHTDLKAARADLHQIAMILKANQPSGTATATGTAKGTATP